MISELPCQWHSDSDYDDIMPMTGMIDENLTFPTRPKYFLILIEFQVLPLERPGPESSAGPPASPGPVQLNTHGASTSESG